MEVYTWAPPLTRRSEGNSACGIGLGVDDVPWRLHSAVFGGFPDFRAQLSHHRPPFVEDQAVHVVGQIGQRDLGLSALDADGADKQPHLVLLVGEDVLDTGANLRFGRVRLRGPFGHRLASGLLAMDAADPALPLEPPLVGLAAMGGIGPDVGCESACNIDPVRG